MARQENQNRPCGSLIGCFFTNSHLPMTLPRHDVQEDMALVTEFSDRWLRKLPSGSTLKVRGFPKYPTHAFRKLLMNWPADTCFCSPRTAIRDTQNLEPSSTSNTNWTRSPLWGWMKCPTSAATVPGLWSRTLLTD